MCSASLFTSLSVATEALARPNVNIIQLNGATVPSDDFICLPRRRDSGSSRLSAEIECRICAELYDRSRASLDLKTWMVKIEVVESVLYGCVAWTPQMATA